MRIYFFSVADFTGFGGGPYSLASSMITLIDDDSISSLSNDMGLPSCILSDSISMTLFMVKYTGSEKGTLFLKSVKSFAVLISTWFVHGLCLILPSSQNKLH